MNKEREIKNIRQIAKIHHEFEEKLNDLKREQDDILAEYLSELEKAKIEDLREKLQS